MQTVIRIAVVAGFGALSVQALCADESAKSSAAKHDTEHSLLGVKLSRLHPALASYLKGVLGPEQGVVVATVEPGSAAEKARIKVHDIITAYDDQKIFSAEQLVKLVHIDRPGRQAIITLVRNGKLQKVEVTLGAKPTPSQNSAETASVSRTETNYRPRPGATQRYFAPRYGYYYPGYSGFGSRAARPYYYGMGYPYDVNAAEQAGGYDESDDTGFYGYGL